MLLEEFDPISMLVTKKTFIKQARFPVVDAHNHLDDDYGGGWIQKPVEEILSAMDDINIRIVIDLDGGWGERVLQKHLKVLGNSIPERFILFGGVNWEEWKTFGNRFPEWAASRMRTQAKWGAAGLKIWKSLGLSVRDQNDILVGINDPRLDAIWQTAAELNWPVMIHAGDPAAFFEPLDEKNERWEELTENPEWHFPSPPYPSLKKILDGFSAMVSKNPKTMFIGAHVGGYSENLGWVSRMLDKNPNFYVDISARLAELGRQPYTARRFFLKYADRVLFGLDGGVRKQAYITAFRFLETDDEYFPYSDDNMSIQGRWNIYGIGLPDDVLKKVYHGNAARLLNLSLNMK